MSFKEVGLLFRMRSTDWGGGLQSSSPPPPLCVRHCSICCSENCEPGVPEQLIPEHKTKCMESELTFLQRCHDDDESFWAGSPQVMKRGLHTTPEIKHVQCIGVTMDLSARPNSSRLCRRRKWCARCSETGGVFYSSSTSWPEVRRWALSVTETLQKLRRVIQNKRRGLLNADVVLLRDNARPHTRFDGQHISYRSSDNRSLIIHPIARTSPSVISIFS